MKAFLLALGLTTAIGGLVVHFCSCTPQERRDAKSALDKACIAIESYNPDAGVVLRIHFVPADVDGGAR